MTALLLLSATSALAAPKKAATDPKSKEAGLALQDEPRKVAEAYLDALAGKGDESARGYLLGGVTFSAEDVTIPNWEIIERKAVVKESAFLAPAIKYMHDLDAAGAKSLTALLDDDKKAPAPKAVTKTLAPTRKQIAAFQKDHPVFAQVARVGKAVYWHPHNPWRLLVESIDQAGKYELEVHVFLVKEAREQKDGGDRTWPLRVVRFKTDSHDTGLKILPASSWDPDF
ncbi:MAG: hypothetical protein P1V51_11165 [Deltaproteobacteria bacterium]|nr:hypothetical protein [Deltaproteobacteria bacterium]